MRLLSRLLAVSGQLMCGAVVVGALEPLLRDRIADRALLMSALTVVREAFAML